MLVLLVDINGITCIYSLLDHRYKSYIESNLFQDTSLYSENIEARDRGTNSRFYIYNYTYLDVTLHSTAYIIRSNHHKKALKIYSDLDYSNNKPKKAIHINTSLIIYISAAISQVICKALLIVIFLRMRYFGPSGVWSVLYILKVKYNDFLTVKEAHSGFVKIK
ncbi:hypothetical protein J3Q64DRAFT_1692768 [Phycomyces blakesleeanus]|uniref:Uncharacterized protein n=2 Tax=Phycomyces blakesleeanus TaxID=4837 RepID=A0A167PB47_PHYB8|nr:hypothetical protein PHYBLDRAFT_60726 [Phycomyces blakesleeanus NRRL 1555(-)]OAD77596.1 hypothetical protein PHYBLDRAFT_60726 [Phycomyces blakesleeanus NRRL 1555(-)]|eukprot:XP_018295636.1 hypothetical protein PHYBLDRAFT_60726 [Phycomyces blakesleeanus NRRL 1555(-)]